MKILFVVENIFIQKDSAGALALLTSHLNLLLASGHDIYNLILAHPQMGSNPSSEDLLRCVPKWDVLQIVRVDRPHGAGARILLSDSEMLVHPILNQENIHAFQQHIQVIQPNIIWCEHLNSAILACRAETNIPIVYSHHDWIWLMQKRKTQSFQTLKFYLLNKIKKSTEEKLVRNVAACVTGSISDKNKMKEVGAKKIRYFPTTYRSVKNLHAVPANVRIVHLGSMNTTANRIGLERFMDVVWNRLLDILGITPELWVIGDLKSASPQLKSALDKAGAVCTGFVDDLSHVLRPFDIHIIPWEFDTGTRTRIPLALNYSQVLVSTQSAAACFEGYLEHNKNCLLVNNLSSMPEIISMAYFDVDIRRKIGSTAKYTFEQQFTIESQQTELLLFLEDLLQ